MALAAGAANAQENKGKMLAGVSAAEIASIMTDLKIESEQLPVPGNEPTIVGMLPSGAKFLVSLGACSEKSENCQVIQYSAIFVAKPLPLADFNTFNSRFAFGKAFQTREEEENRMVIRHAVIVAEGISRKAVKENMVLFVQVTGFFVRFLSERMNTVSASADKPAGDKPDAITNVAGELPADQTLASFGETARKHPGIINKVTAKEAPKWAIK
ncbi:MAG: YbjN domain-containing protein [Alphaproteobacteria bacterium]